MTVTDSALIVAEDLPIITPNRDVVVSSLTLKVGVKLSFISIRQSHLILFFSRFFDFFEKNSI